MTDFQPSLDNSDPSSTFFLGSTRYYCQSCRRPFSLIRSDPSLTQAQCPRCNQHCDQISSRRFPELLRSRTELLVPLDTDSQSESQPQQEPQIRQQQDQQIQIEPQVESQADTHQEQELEPQVEFQSEPQLTQESQSQPESDTQQNSTSEPQGSPIYLIQTIVDPINGRIFIQRIPLTHLFTSTQSQGEEAENDHDHEHHHNFGSLLRLIIPLMNPTAMHGENILEILLRGDSHQHGRPPASQDAMDKLEKFTYSTMEDEAPSSCPVCYEDYKEGDDSLVRLPCKHEYHGNCVKTWLGSHNSCPMCRQEI